MHVMGCLLRLLAIHQILKVALMNEIYLLAIILLICRTIYHKSPKLFDRWYQGLSTLQQHLCLVTFLTMSLHAFVAVHNYVAGMEVDAHHFFVACACSQPQLSFSVHTHK
jgi:hypothetical protein